MAIGKAEFREAVAAGARATVVGSQGGLFHILCADLGCLAADGRPIAFPSLNHAADFSQRCGVVRFEVDVRLWRASDTARSPGAARP